MAHLQNLVAARASLAELGTNATKSGWKGTGLCPYNRRPPNWEAAIARFGQREELAISAECEMPKGAAEVLPLANKDTLEQMFATAAAKRAATAAPAAPEPPPTAPQAGAAPSAAPSTQGAPASAAGAATTAHPARSCGASSAGAALASPGAATTPPRGATTAAPAAQEPPPTAPQARAAVGSGACPESNRVSLPQQVWQGRDHPRPDTSRVAGEGTGEPPAHS